MKNKSKLMLLATSLLTVSIAASATSAFAWYTAAREAQLSMTQIGITSKGANLSVAYVDSTSTGIKESAATGKGTSEDPYKITSNVSLTDVSSNGDGNYVKPRIAPDGSTILDWYDSAFIKAHVLQFKLKFTNTSAVEGSGNNLQLFLRGDSKPAADATMGIHEALRYSIQDSQNAVLMYANPLGTENTYWASGSTGSKGTLSNHDTATVTGNTLAISTGLFANGNEHTSFDETEVTGNNVASKGYLVQLAPKETVTLTFNVWVEGTDPQAVLKDPAKYTSAGITLPFNFYAIETAPAA